MSDNKNYNNALDFAKNYSGKSEKCTYDVLIKLKKYKLNQEEINSIIEELKKEKFIDEVRYTKAFINDKFKFNKWGKIKIFYALKQKGIEEKIISKQLDSINQDEYIQTLSEIIKNKKSKIKETQPLKRKAALMRYATQRGFEPDIVNQILD